MHANIFTRVGVSLLTEIIEQSKYNGESIKQLGIEPCIIQQLSTMSIYELYELAQSSCVKYSINTEHLGFCVHKIIQGRNQDKLVNEAILLGASRMMMKQIANISYGNFNKRRMQLDLFNKRNKPHLLTNDEYQQLAILHDKYKKQHSIISRLDNLRCLIFLSKQTKIDINRIYQYFYLDNQILFTNQYHHANTH
ncbi:STY4526/YPO1902 family pathogenicity island replication protein [Pasteurella atlantica]|uniref:STY4526/YPO1902 family pathogenicity island replication protein n=2 Tax=Pasteurellaceae TaxID=712 RepID=A0ACC6HLL6_9PAST|nr:STY4526/YPO1902 family pathogenicity island replication protein [Pasteurella atlantica]MDP8051536.1 STY4526/YPO1902 family pathogenicity island replication protein [Pasteurella atlantica]MDP8104885.1 STY4526/YPO1902 family pathogenicity island replication protein [Pasteurella atlantica]MDP8148259.1 STY4526/YPO1902 family pathogenicity island replication protein [Pasteurella atlantica]